MEIIRSVCPYDCPDTCGLLLHKENGRVVKVTGDPQHSFTRGTLCPKMAHYERTVYSDRRLTTPLRRSGPKGSGDFTPISWNEAIAEIATHWKAILQSDGGDAILQYFYAGTMGLVQRNTPSALFNALGAGHTLNTICSPAKGNGYKAVMGGTISMRPQEAQQSDLILLWSVSTLATDIHFVHDIDEARKNGAKVWLIDTYETPTAKIADKTFRVQPGTDGALALGIMHILDRDGLTDAAFLNQYVQGWNELAQTILPKYPPATVSAITGISAADLEYFAHTYAAAKAPFIRLGSGLSRYGNGATTVRLVSCLPASIGAWTRPGGGMFTGSATGTAFDVAVVTGEQFRPHAVRAVNMNQIGDALCDTTDNPIKSIYIYNSNPACTAPDQNRVIQGLSREDLFTVVHERFLTDTARYADIVLPATSSLEHDDIYSCYGHYTAQRAFAAIEPLGEAKSNWDVTCLLAQAMGITDPFFQQTAAELIDKIVDTTAKWPVPFDREALRRGEGVELPLPADYKMNFKTPSGKIEILNPAEKMPLPDYFPAYGDDAEFWLINAPDARILDSSFNERDELTKNNTMVLLMNLADAARHGLRDGQRVVASNERGKASFTLKISEKTAPAVVVTEGVWWIEHTGGDRSVNALTAQRLTDHAAGSTFYDVKVDVTAAQ